MSVASAIANQLSKKSELVISAASDFFILTRYALFHGGNEMSLASMIELKPWAMTEAGLRVLNAVADRESDIEALEKSLGRKPGYTHSFLLARGYHPSAHPRSDGSFPTAWACEKAW